MALKAKDADGNSIYLDKAGAGSALDPYTDGTPITGQSLETGGQGPIGWLASVRKAITDRLPANLGANGGLKIEGVASGTGTKTNVAASASSTTLLAANANRVGGVIVNDSSAICYVDMSGGTASATSYTYLAAPGATVEIPAGYTGAITGIWASAVGAARITEFT